MLLIINQRPVLFDYDKTHLFSLAIYLALKGDTSMLERFKQELIELWNGDGI